MNTYVQLVMYLLFSQLASPPGPPREFHWDWHQAQSLFSAPSLKDANISASEGAALAKAIESQIGPPDPHDPEMASEDQVRQAALNANIKTIDLNRDAEMPFEVVAQVQHSCSPVGNCSLWFFRRTPHGYKLVLDAIGQGFTVQKTATNGIRDVVVDMHSSATEQWLKVYRYARGRYWRVACYDADHSEPPRITPSLCK